MGRGDPSDRHRRRRFHRGRGLDRGRPHEETTPMLCIPSTTSVAPAVLRLADAEDPTLARASRAGLPVLPGFVLTPDGAEAIARATAARPAGNDVTASVRAAWSDLTQHGSRSLVVRSSSTVEDGVDSSMAGRFTSVLDVRGWDSFVDAVREVVASGDAVHEGMPNGGRMAVLVQPFLEPEA